MSVNVDSFGDDCRAVSEVIGYALSFSIILLVSTIVVISAGPIIDTAESENAHAPVENVFIQLSDGTMDVQDGSDVKVVERQLPSGQLNTLGDSTLEFDSDSSGDVVVIETQPLEFMTENGDVVIYESGFVTKRLDNEPIENTDLRYTHVDSFNHGEIMRIPEIQTGANQSDTGSTRASAYRFEMRQNDSGLSASVHDFSGDPVELTVTTEIPGSWEVYLENHEKFTNVSREGNTVSADVTETEFKIVSQEMSMGF